MKSSNLYILSLLISFASVSALLFTPALPQLAREFGVSDAKMQLTVSLYLIGYSLGQLPYGPLANRYGRKRAIFCGLSLSLIGCILCLYAPFFGVLCAGRFLQALGAAVGLKITYTIIRDCYEGAAATRAISYVALSFCAAPGLAVALGGWLTVTFGWRGCFVFLALYTFLLGALSLLLPETADVLDRSALQYKRVIHNLSVPFTNTFLILNSVIYGMGTGLIYVFASEAPYIAIEKIGLTPDQYGLWNLVPSIGLGLGLALIGRLAHRIQPQFGVAMGLLISFIGVTTLFFVFIYDFLSPATFFFPMILVLAGVGLTGTIASSKALSVIKDRSNAAAAMGFINMGIGTLWALGAWTAAPINPIAMVAIFATILLFESIVLIKLKHNPSMY